MSGWERVLAGLQFKKFDFVECHIPKIATLLVSGLYDKHESSVLN